ncbi:NAD(P)H nitroreductase [Mycolicibacterium sp. ND9-15]|uniref:Acg family FMN-binding oxidoreductase n=1 Tax=Mycolicibacterium sp. ND9-15 TaxID=3042320 RepID=UPI002DDABDEF|nr:NAD(P)H nitroreductase [Mycolicibacterium sp. ND9-15]WSE55007.1 NAD(P)H nitroreductase [Mycolicibacterium sp. ND9-15]
MPYPIVDTEVVKRAVQLACRAPSLHNSQPWRWVVDGPVVQLFVDPARAPAHTDRTGKETLIGCGAVLDHFRVAMAALGWTANIDRFPNPNNRHHLASIDFSPTEFVTEGHRRRADAISVRRTDRLPFAAPSDWESVEGAMRGSSTDDAVRLDVVPDKLRPALAQASRLAESLRLYDSQYHAEIWQQATDSPAATGIPRSALVTAAEGDRVGIGRRFPATSNPERREEIGEDQSKIVVLSTYDDTQDSMLRCGETLSAVLLDATMAGLATCTLTHITELAESRQLLSALIGPDVTPQAIVRVGEVPSTEDLGPLTPRRPIDEVFQVSRNPTGEQRG